MDIREEKKRLDVSNALAQGKMEYLIKTSKQSCEEKSFCIYQLLKSMKISRSILTNEISRTNDDCCTYHCKRYSSDSVRYEPREKERQVCVQASLIE